MSEKNTPKTYDLITTGVGYLNRAREVAPKGGTPYNALTVTAFRGKEPNVNRTYIDCIVVGEKANHAFAELKDRINSDKGVFARFVIGDINAEPFVYQSGEKKGQTGVSVKGRLLRVPFAICDGERIDFEPRSDDPTFELNHEAAPTADDSAPEESEENTPPASVAPDNADKPADNSDIVYLSKDEPDFEARKKQLKADGYKWNNELKGWVPPAKAAA